MTEMILMTLPICGFCGLIGALYLPMCALLYVGYRRRGGRKSLWRYINEDC